MPPLRWQEPDYSLARPCLFKASLLLSKVRRGSNYFYNSACICRAPIPAAYLSSNGNCRDVVKAHCIPECLHSHMFALIRCNLQQSCPRCGQQFHHHLDFGVCCLKGGRPCACASIPCTIKWNLVALWGLCLVHLLPYSYQTVSHSQQVVQ